MSDERVPNNVETGLLDQRLDEAVKRYFIGGGGPGGGPDERITRLESSVTEIKITLARIEERLGHMVTDADFAELKGRVSQLPTIWQLFSIIIAVFGFAFVLVRFGLPRN